MMTIKLATAAFVAAALAVAPFAAQAKKHKRVTHHVSTMQVPAYSGSAGVSATQPAPTQPATTYGTSGRPVGTVTAPSVGSYYWPSVGVTNAVPTWSNTGPR